MTVTQTRRTEFWRLVDAELLAGDLENASNREIDAVINRTTCPRIAARMVIQMRSPCVICGTPTRVRDAGKPTCLNCVGRSIPDESHHL